MSFSQERLLATGDKRHWVRITRACNSKCIFCLDMDNLDGTHVPDEEVRRTIEEGRKKGNTRLILSGGEASTNPRFAEYIAYGKELGYERVQTISNGRMYHNMEYVKKLVDAGLDEITFSVHGHTAELHDKLVAGKGSFRQIVKGIENAVELRDTTGWPIVSIDIVMTKLNYKHIHEIIELFAHKKVFEYDLLHLTPFGNAGLEENREALYFDMKEAYPYLRKAFEYAKVPGFHIWTNRFPVEFLEDLEYLIQDPRKMKDEVIGRRKLFATFFKERKDFPCKGWRCTHCHMKGLCQEVHKERDIWDRKEFSHVLLDFQELSEERLAFLAPLLTRMPLKAICIAGLTELNKEQCLTLLKSLHLPELTLILQDVGDRELILSCTPYGKVELKYTKELRGVPILTEFPYTIGLTRQNFAEALLLAKRIPDITFSFPNYAIIDDTLRYSIDPLKSIRKNPPLYAFLRERVTFENVPKCILDGLKQKETIPCFDLSLITEDDTIDLDRYVPYYNANYYYHKGVRCDDCSLKNSCKGYHVNAIRAFGLKSLQPIPSSSSHGTK